MKKFYIKNNINYIILLKYFNKIISYKNIKLLKIFMTEEGKIYSKKETGLNTKQQHILAKNIKKARNFGLINSNFKIKIN